MKMTKFKLISLVLVFLAIVLIPNQSVSKDNGPESVVLTSKNLLVLNGEVNGDSVGAVMAKAKELDAANAGFLHKKEPFYLFLNTPGGEIQSGLELIEAMNGLGRPVHTVTIFAASMGFQIAQNLSDRLILKNGTLMSHHAAGEFSGQFGGQKASMDSRYEFWLDRVRELDEQTVKRTNGKQTYDSYTKRYDHEVWLTGTKSVAEGYADRIVLVKCDSSLAGATTHHLAFFGMDISYDIDNCPLNGSPMNIKIVGPGGKTILTSNEETETKNRFVDSYEKKARTVIPMYYK
jgi:ATP-dependent Clp protease protease subunit